MVNHSGVHLGRGLHEVTYGLLIFSLSLDHLHSGRIESGGVSTCGSILRMVGGAILGHVDDALGEGGCVHRGVLLGGSNDAIFT